VFIPLGSEVELVIDSASTRTMRYLGVDFWVAFGYLDKVGSVSGLVEVEEHYGLRQ